MKWSTKWRLLEYILVFFFALYFVFILYVVSAPIWSDSVVVCKYWDKTETNEMNCIEYVKIYTFERK